jgi:hypothetical protein
MPLLRNEARPLPQLTAWRRAGGAEQFLAHGPHFNRFQRGGADISAGPRALLAGRASLFPNCARGAQLRGQQTGQLSSAASDWRLPPSSSLCERPA